MTATTPTSREDDHNQFGPGVARAAVTGAAIGFVLAAGGAAIAGSANGMETTTALGFGAFVGTWGGAGFGVMLASTLAVIKNMED